MDDLYNNIRHEWNRSGVIRGELAGELRCMYCGKFHTLTTTTALRYLKQGWPTCCGYTMRWLTENEFSADTTPPASD